MSSETDQITLSNIDNDIIIDISTVEISINKNKKTNIISLPYDIIFVFFSWCPILGLTCKEFNKLCPIKPNGYYYNKVSEWHMPIGYLFGGNIYYYYRISINRVLPIIESDKFRSLNIRVPDDLVEIKKVFKYVYENNIPFDDFKYKDALICAIRYQKKGLGYCNLEFYDSIIVSFLMNLYH